MGSKAQRQNQHLRRLMSKVHRFKEANKSTVGLEKELAFCMGDADRPAFKTVKRAASSTGRASDF